MRNMGQSLCCNNYLCTKSANVDNNTNVQISYTYDLNDLPHKCSEILKDHASMDVNTYCKDKLYDMLHKGIVFSDGKTKYWVDKETGKNCFMLFAKNLTIYDQMDPRKWTWQRSKESYIDMSAEMAVMGKVKTLSVHGSFNTEFLSPDTKYKVEFVLRLKKGKHVTGWSKNPVRSVLIPPEKTWNEAIQNKVNLAEKGSQKSFEILAGEFFNPQFNSHGEIQFYLDEVKEWKTGLVIKGVKITPLI
ncbi:lectin-like [Solanum pennellii]|uniref:Lectin-like n=1 Tax=Solanum pennellii TaxID=28526 RepID=A0ABM1G130_SOLPN|nr:lectin-like [Solanum pennellii]